MLGPGERTAECVLPLFGAGNFELSLWLGMVQSCHLRIALHNDGRTRVEARQCGDFSLTTLAGAGHKDASLAKR